MLHQHDFNHVQVNGFIGFSNGHHSIHYSLQTNVTVNNHWNDLKRAPIEAECNKKYQLQLTSGKYEQFKRKII